jgi:hypothetical protein
MIMAKKSGNKSAPKDKGMGQGKKGSGKKGSCKRK